MKSLESRVARLEAALSSIMPDWDEGDVISTQEFERWFLWRPGSTFERPALTPRQEAFAHSMLSEILEELARRGREMPPRYIEAEALRQAGHMSAPKTDS